MSPEDRKNNVRTTAVLLGTARAAWIYRAIMVLSTAYGFFWMKSYATLALLLTVLIPLTPEKAARSWDLARIITGTVWLVLIVQIYLGYMK